LAHYIGPIVIIITFAEEGSRLLVSLSAELLKNSEQILTDFVEPGWARPEDLDSYPIFCGFLIIFQDFLPSGDRT